MKTASIGILPTSVRLVSCISLFGGPRWIDARRLSSCMAPAVDEAEKTGWRLLVSSVGLVLATQFRR